jgi:hypothetical protein
MHRKGRPAELFMNFGSPPQMKADRNDPKTSGHRITLNHTESLDFCSTLTTEYSNRRIIRAQTVVQSRVDIAGLEVEYFSFAEKFGAIANYLVSFGDGI